MLAGTDAGTGVGVHVGVWGGILLFSPTVWTGSGAKRRDTHTHKHTHRNTHIHTQEHTHTEERKRECCTYPIATYPLKHARNKKHSVLTNCGFYEFILGEPVDHLQTLTGAF